MSIVLRILRNFFFFNAQMTYVKFIYSEKATKFCEIFTLLLTGTKVKISQNFVAFSEYMNFTYTYYLCNSTQ